MKRKILALFLMGSILLTACGKETPLSEQKSTTENKVSTTEEKTTTQNKEGTTKEKDTQDIKTPVDKDTGLKLSAVSVVNLSKYTNNEELSLSESPTSIFILTTDSVLTNFKIQNISYDGVKCEVNENLYNKKSFDTSMSLKIEAYIPEIFSNLLISYEKDGNIYQYYVVSNLTGEGADADLQLVK
ncbi:hypothetical protein [Clostridium sp. UBA1056]|uniref:hypothetical protein n=1 Tax=unclassified Clostridium TaxID=2614128 RepID=UPI0032179A38